LATDLLCLLDMKNGTALALAGLVAASTACGNGGGVHLNKDSSFAYSFDSSFAKFVPPGNGCGAQYTGVMASDPKWDRSVEFTFVPPIELTHEYMLTPQPPSPNFLVGNGLAIQVNVNGIETVDAADHVAGGSVTVDDLTSNLAFGFMIQFADGKNLQGAFNLPLDAGQCPPRE
jgi:hypothetical protein